MNFYAPPSSSYRIETFHELQSALAERGISTHNWVKSLGDLWREIEDGDCNVEIKDGELLRTVEEVRVRCYFIDARGSKFKLHEDQQIFSSGKARCRNFDYIVEKKQFGEAIETAALRGLQEELQIDTDRIELIPQSELNDIKTQESPSYPGIKSTYVRYNFFVQIPEDQFRGGYQEEKNGKTTYFSWKKC